MFQIITNYSPCAPPAELDAVATATFEEDTAAEAVIPPRERRDEAPLTGCNFAGPRSRTSASDTDTVLLFFIGKANTSCLSSISLNECFLSNLDIILCT